MVFEKVYIHLQMTLIFALLHRQCNSLLLSLVWGRHDTTSVSLYEIAVSLPVIGRANFVLEVMWLVGKVM